MLILCLLLPKFAKRESYSPHIFQNGGIAGTFTPAKISMFAVCKLSKELNDGIEILVGQVVFKLWIKTAEILFSSVTPEPLDLFKC